MREERGTRHEVWKLDATRGRAAVPRHRSGEIPTGTLRSIVRGLGIEWEVFLRA